MDLFDGVNEFKCECNKKLMDQPYECPFDSLVVGMNVLNIDLFTKLIKFNAFNMTYNLQDYNFNSDTKNILKPFKTKIIYLKKVTVLDVIFGNRNALCIWSNNENVRGTVNNAKDRCQKLYRVLYSHLCKGEKRHNLIIDCNIFFEKIFGTSIKGMLRDEILLYFSDFEIINILKEK